MHNLKNIYRGGLGGHVCFQCRRYASVKTHYEVLGVAKSASQKEIKSAYIDLSKKFHPDTAGSTSKTRFTEINEAYSVLNKPLSRKEYDNRIAYESASRSHSFYGDNRPPGSGRPRYPPPGSGRPGYPPPPGYERDQRYNQWSSNQQYNPYSEAERKREKAMKNAREKQFEERLKKFREFEQDLYNVKTTGKRRFFRFLDFYLGTVFMCSILMTFYGLNSLKVTRRLFQRHIRRKHPSEFIYHMRVLGFILLAQAVLLIAILLDPPHPGYRVAYSAHDYSELRRRYEYFYGPHGKENRQRTKASAEEYKSQADQEKEVLNVITICVVLALLLTLLRFTGIGKFAAGSNTKSGAVRMGNFDNNPAIVVLCLLFILCIMSGTVLRKAAWHHSSIKKLDLNSRADQIRSPSDDMKAEIDRSIVPRRAEEKDITPPRM